MFPSLKFGDLIARVPIVQGGMGVGISLSGLASAVANEGGIGVIAGAMIGMLDPDVTKDPTGANIRAMKKEIEKFQAQAVENMKNQLVAHAENRNGVKVVKAVLPIAANAAKDLVFKVREAIPENLFCVIGSTENGRPLISVMISDDLVKNHELNAGALVREAGKLIQGGGGGQPHYATAGGKNADGLSAAVDKVIELAKL